MKNEVLSSKHKGVGRKISGGEGAMERQIPRNSTTICLSQCLSVVAC